MNEEREALAKAWESGLNTGIGFAMAQRVIPDAPEPKNLYRPTEDDDA